MKKFYFVLLSALMLTTLNANADNAGRKLQALKDNPISHFLTTQPKDMLQFASSARTSQHRVTDFTKTSEIKDAPDYGTLVGDDGSTWFWTASSTESSTFEYAYGSTTISLYDGSNQPVTTVTINVPDTMRVNDIEPFGYVSTKFYDTNSKTKEFTAYMHEIGQNYTSIGHFLVYNTDGELVKQYDNLGNIIWFDASVKYDTYQRAVFVNAGVDSLGNATTRMSIMKNASWSAKEPQEEHVFEVRDDLIEYSYGPCLNTYNIDGKPYYMLSHYEKPFVSGYDENYDMILNEDNNYVVEIYDKDYNQVSSFKVPVTHPDDVYCSTYTCGLYSYNDLCKGYFSLGDSELLNVVITRQDVRLDTDDDTYPYTFLVYDQHGNLINTIAENVISWKQMTDIRGAKDQVGCLCLNDGVEDLEMIELPDCQKVAAFAAETNGRKISANYDRYPVGSSYEYVIGMGDAEADADNNVISSIGWFKQDGTLDHYVKFNIGQSGEYFTPLIEGYSLDPSLFNTDSAHEYVYIAKIRRTDGSDKIDNVLIVSDENGNEIQRYSGDDDRKLRVASVIDSEIGSPRLVVGLYDENEDTYDFDFYKLPFVKFAAGGDGSKENPYVITSAGDLKQMVAEPSAHYVLGKNIDMCDIADPFTPISQFTGTLDGQGNAVYNLYINTEESYTGLFGYLVNEGSYVKNIYFANPYIKVKSGNRYVGVIAGMTMKTAIDSVFVSNLVIEGEGNAEVGGLVGQATYYTTIGSCYVKDAYCYIPNCSNVGGIAGDTRTSTTVDACYFGGSIVAKNILGGIVGTTGNGSTVKNCHVFAGSLEAENTVGGVVGAASRNEISNNLVEGMVGASVPDMYGNACVGGIVGSLESLWQGTATVVVNGNVAALNGISPEDASAVHRIVGFTIADEQYEEDETHRTEAGLANNYAINTIQAFGDKGANLVDGADVVNIDKAFLEGIGFQFGMDTTAPWQGDYLVKLYFEENEAPSGIHDVTEIIPAGNSVMYNIAGQRVNSSASGIIIKNGRKYLVK